MSELHCLPSAECFDTVSKDRVCVCACVRVNTGSVKVNSRVCWCNIWNACFWNHVLGFLLLFNRMLLWHRSRSTPSKDPSVQRVQAWVNESGTAHSRSQAVMQDVNNTATSLPVCPNIPGSPAGPPRAAEERCAHKEEDGKCGSYPPNMLFSLEWPKCAQLHWNQQNLWPLAIQTAKKKKADYCQGLHFEKLEAQQLRLASAHGEPCGISTHTDPKPQGPTAQRGLYLSWARPLSNTPLFLQKSSTTAATFRYNIH